MLPVKISDNVKVCNRQNFVSYTVIKNAFKVSFLSSCVKVQPEYLVGHYLER